MISVKLSLELGRWITLNALYISILLRQGFIAMWGTDSACAIPTKAHWVVQCFFCKIYKSTNGDDLYVFVLPDKITRCNENGIHLLLEDWLN